MINDLTGTDCHRSERRPRRARSAERPATALADTTTVNGTNGANTITVAGAAGTGTVTVSGCPPWCGSSTPKRPTTRWSSTPSAATTRINADHAGCGNTLLTVDGGAGNDTILGSAGADTLIGGDGNDTIDGNQGNDVARMGAGNDTFIWDPGDGSDTVEGEAGTDTMLFNGANVAENINLVANGGARAFTRDVAQHHDGHGRRGERDVHARAAERTTSHVGDLTGTDVTRVNIDLGSTPSGGRDDAADTVTVQRHQGADVFGACDGQRTSPCVGLGTAGADLRTPKRPTTA